MDRYAFNPSKDLLQQLEAIAGAEGTAVPELIAKWLNKACNEWQPDTREAYNTDVRPFNSIEPENHKLDHELNHKLNREPVAEAPYPTENQTINHSTNTKVQPNEINNKINDSSKELHSPSQEELNSTFGPASGGPTKHKPKPKPDVPVRKLDPERYVHYGRGPHS
jgi:hypothetical protein